MNDSLVDKKVNTFCNHAKNFKKENEDRRNSMNDVLNKALLGVIYNVIFKH